MNQKEVNNLLSGLLEGGLIFEKEVKKCTPTSGAIYLPKKLIGKNFRIFLVPVKGTSKGAKAVVDGKPMRYNEEEQKWEDEKLVSNITGEEYVDAGDWAKPKEDQGDRIKIDVGATK